MEQKKHPIEKENHLNQTSIFRFHVKVAKVADFCCQGGGLLPAQPNTSLGASYHEGWTNMDGVMI